MTDDELMSNDEARMIYAASIVIRHFCKGAAGLETFVIILSAVSQQ